MAIFNKIFQKSKLITSKTFYLLTIVNSRLSSVGFKLLSNGPTILQLRNFCHVILDKRKIDKVI